MKRERLPGDGQYAGLTFRGVHALRLTACIVALLLLPEPAPAQIRTITVDSHGDVGKYSSIAVDLNNRSHIGYYDATRQILKYAMIDGDNLSIAVVDNSTGVGGYCAIAVDGNNEPHIVYYDATHKDLKYAVRHGSHWTIQTVDATGDVGMFTSIAVDQINNPYISYYDHGNGYLKLAYRENGTWIIKSCCEVELYEGMSQSGRSTAIRLDHIGSNPLILFFDNAGRTLKLGIYDRTLGQWQAEYIRDADLIIQDLSLSLDTANQPHVAFSEVSTMGIESVHYCMKRCLGSGCLTQVTPAQPTGEGTWDFEQGDIGAGNFVSLALDLTQNLPQVIYYDLACGLRRAQKTETGWSLETVDPGYDVGLYGSFVLDHSNDPHISYYDRINGDLKYAGTLVPRPIDVWIKDCPQDNGMVPYTQMCIQPQSSPDIWFDNDGNGAPDDPVPGVRNTIKARVRNRGFSRAENVTVRFYVIDLRLPLPSNINDALTLIGSRTVSVNPHDVKIASIRWTPPAWIQTRNWCIGVVLDHPADHPVTPFVFPQKDNNLAAHCFLLSNP